MLMALSAKSKLCLINGSMTKPSYSSPDFKAWMRYNDMVLSWIINSVSKEISASIIYINSAEAVWKDLKERFSQGNGPHIFQLQKYIAATSQNSNSVSSYFTQLKSIWDELYNYRPIPQCLCGLCICDYMNTVMDFHHQEYVYHFLMGLNDSFSNIRGQILLIEPLPPINKVFSLVLQDERQREVFGGNFPSSQFTDSSALLSSTSSTSQNVKQQSHCKTKPTCSHCGVIGHTVEKCYRIHGFPPGFKFTQVKPPTTSSANQVQATDSSPMPFTQAQCQQLMAFMQNNISFSASSSALQAGSVSTTTDRLIPTNAGKSMALIHSEFVSLFSKYILCFFFVSYHHFLSISCLDYRYWSD